jgi:23S rRNA (guanine2445-N2)-methyltransferase / 23S rRNA (guanine2069-N7)-methyltransferase
LNSFFATCARGLGPLVADELRALGGDQIVVERAGAAFSGTLETAYRACLWSRVSSRILMPLASFAAADEEALYAGVRTIRWREHLGPKQTLAVDFTSARSAISQTHFGALKTKDAIVDQLRDETGSRPSVDTVRPDVRVNVFVHEDRATVSIDLAGDSLHRRGWRAAGVEAPLKENLAAAILLLANYPARAREGAPLVDPMCGSGTLPIEAALIATDTAPGLGRSHWGFVGWRGHDAPLWRRLTDEARDRRVRDPERRPPIAGWDADARAVRSARENAARADVAWIGFERRELANAEPTLANGLLVMNPPYGERLGEAAALGPLYEQIGDVLRRRFTGWTGFVLTGNLELAKKIGLRPARRHVVFNGAIECRLLEYPIANEAPRAPARPRATIRAEAFANRVRKNLSHLRKWAKREDVHCFRVYDADLVEYAVALDLYEDAAHVQEYAPPSTIDPARAEERLQDVIALVPELLGVAATEVYVKQRRRQRDGEQYEKLGGRRRVKQVREGGHRFVVNLSDYLDTGLFLDHRRMRALIGELAPGRTFLNLFAYTGSASVYAAAAGARSSTSVDLSNTYLDWAGENFRINGIDRTRHRLVRADCDKFLAESPERFDLIFCAPPTYSKSKGMEHDFDLQRDHVALLRACARLLDDDGVLLFSNHFRRFKMDEAALSELRVDNITKKTLPIDFQRDPRFHNSWRITRRR